ncbi:DUF2178 domain-containing protein [Thermococcus waiotapuensis]|uniref:DUF2178 domain-containing protein n=1 Tax=Thermococcus waiotapuensis TaxID=90909 RepID=A0AAE4T3B5_9EURY|nr:DUF2178 domain-containing protein [Thermococcus waiotapuensis]MDV3103566.1 DUF2178 domain-containing protein [Thermococcus waiotapuensis]
MDWAAFVALAAGFIGGILGYLLTRGIVEDIGVPLDERGNEIAKLAAARTLELVLLTDAVLLYYSAIVAKDDLCTGVLFALFAMILFGNLAFRAYYSRKM